MKKTDRTTEQTVALVSKVEKLVKANPETSVPAECEKVDLPTSVYYYHTKGKHKNKKGSKKGKKSLNKKPSKKLEFQEISLPVSGGNHLLLITPDRDLIEKVLEKYRA